MARDLGLIRGFELIELLLLDQAFTFIRCDLVLGVEVIVSVKVRIARLLTLSLHIGDVVVRHTEFQRIELLLFPSRHLVVVVGLLDCF